MKTIFNDTYKYLPSPNQSPRPSEKILGSCIHYTAGGSARATATWLRNPEIERSYHFIVGREGDVYQLVPLDRMSWACGASEWFHPAQQETVSWLNRSVVNIALANYGRLAHEGGHFWYEMGGTAYLYSGPEPEWAVLHYDNGLTVPSYWEPYREAQIEALSGLYTRLTDEGVPPHTVGHEEVGMPFGRKTDPGGVFPWDCVGRLHGKRTWRG